MSILSISFVLFVLILIAFYYLLPAKFSPYIILLGSVYFYTRFDYRYSFFLLGSIVCVYFGALLIHRAPSKKIKKLILAIVLICNIGLLFFVKFVPRLLEMAKNMKGFPSLSISILVPLGISFYTLQLCGYLIDIYREKYKPERNFFKFASFSTFFPLMLQGPISRYDQLSRTLFSERKRDEFYENITSGAQIMLWGFFKKLVIADRAALLVNEVFDNHSSYSGVAVIIASLCYTLQIYTDFSGCVDICRGAAKTFGIQVVDNFNQPYLSISIQDFWKRWHISLSSWLRDYVYIPLGGNRKGIVRKYLNLIIVFFVSGLWHGVGIHYIIWGLLQAFYQIIGAVTLPFKKKLCSFLHINRNCNAYIWFQRLITFMLVNISWVFFRAINTSAIFEMLSSMLRFDTNAELLAILDLSDVAILVLGSLALLIIGFYREKGISIRQKVSACPIPVRWTLYLSLFLIVLILGVYGPGYSDSAFIYMNF